MTPSRRFLILLAALAPRGARADDAGEAASAWSLHAQTTYILQMHPGFDADYSGPNSLVASQESRHTVSVTGFLGRALWPGASLYYDPEVTVGQGLSGTLGIAGFPNGEGTRASSNTPQYDTARLFIRQVIDLSGESSRIDDAPNQVAGKEDANRLTFTVGKFSATDVFDANAYSHDARSQFLNWALVDDGAWDYPADAKGYTVGFAAEWTAGNITLRYGIFMEPREANMLPLDSRVDRAHGQVLEWERRYLVGSHPGTVRPRVYWNQAHMGLYQAALEEPGTPDIISTRAYRSKAGAGLSWDQEVADQVGVFARAGFNDGRTETWAYTEIDRSISTGLSVGGKAWGRAGDTLGVAALANALSPTTGDTWRPAASDLSWATGASAMSPKKSLKFTTRGTPSRGWPCRPTTSSSAIPDTTGTADPSACLASAPTRSTESTPRQSNRVDLPEWILSF